MPDKSWEPGTLPLSHSLTLSLSRSLTLDMLNNFCFHVYAEKSHSHTLTLSHSHTLSFTLSRHAEQLLSSCLCSKVTVYCRKLQCFFLHQHHHQQQHPHLLLQSSQTWFPAKNSESQTGAGNLKTLKTLKIILGIMNNFCFHVYAQKCHVVRLSGCQGENRQCTTVTLRLQSDSPLLKTSLSICAVGIGFWASVNKIKNYSLYMFDKIGVSQIKKTFIFPHFWSRNQ